MKKLFTVLISLLVVLSLAACTQKPEPQPEPEPTPEPEPAPQPVEAQKVNHAEYVELPTDGSAVVTIESYVQAAQSYWDGGASLYLQDKDGAYFVYSGLMSEEDFAKLVDSTDFSDGWTGLGNGTKVQVTGTKTEWAGEVELSDAVVTVIDDGDKWFAEAYDVTGSLPTDPADHMNEKVKMSDMTVVAAYEDGPAFLYNWDGSGSEGSDLYFYVEKDGLTYTFVVESYLCYNGSDVYETVENLEVGQVVDLEGFLYWYEGPQPHITSVTVK